MSRFIKRILFAFIFLFLIGIALYPREILLKYVEWKAKGFCKDAFGGTLSFDSLDWEESKIILKQGRIHGERGFQATFSTASILPFFDWKKRELGGELEIEGLKIIHRKKEPFYSPNPSLPKGKLFSLNLKTTIKDGELLLYDYLSQTCFFQKVNFDLVHYLVKNQVFGDIELDLNPQIAAHFWKSKEGVLRLTSRFHSHSFPAVSQLFTYFFQERLPEPVMHWVFTEGTIDGNLEVALMNGEPLKLQGDVTFSGVKGENRILELMGEIDLVESALDIDFSKISSINGTFNLTGGRLALKEEELWKGIWDLRNLHSNICIKEGKVESSTLQGDFLGMQGELVLDWNSMSDTLMKMSFNGCSKEMTTLLPDFIQERFKAAFPKDDFAFNASLKRSGEGLQLEGSLSILDEIKSTYTLVFGCFLGCGGDSEIDLDLVPDRTIPCLFDRVKALGLNDRKRPNINSILGRLRSFNRGSFHAGQKGKELCGRALVPENLPFSLSRSVDSFLEHLKHQFCLSQKRVVWFRGNQFPLEKFLTPFLLHDVQIVASGLADFEGTFDERFLAIFYEGENFQVDSPHFCLKADKVDKEISSDIVAVHYLDLQTWAHVGFLPLKEASYYQKNHDLMFKNAEAIVNFDNHTIRIQDIRAESEAVNFQGEVEIAIKALDDVDLQIKVDTLSGPAPGANALLKHFNDSIFWQLPLEGEIYSEDHPLFFHYHFSPKASLIKGNIQGEIDVSFQSSLLSIQHYRAHVSYDFNQAYLTIEEGKGELILPKRQDPFNLKTSKVSFSEFPDFLFSGSIEISDKEQTILTLDALSQRITEGKEIVVQGKSSFLSETLYLKALQQKNVIYVDEFVCGEWRGDGKFDCQRETISIENLNCSMNQNDTFNFSGVYELTKGFLKGYFQEVKWNLADILPSNKNLFPWKPKGEVTGSATIQWKIGDECQIRGSASFEDLEFGGIFFGKGEELRCFYSSLFGISVEGLEVEVSAEEGIEKYKLGRFHYDIEHQKILFEGFDFSLPPEKLPRIAAIAETLFPGKIHPTVADAVEALKQNEPLEGNISLEIYPDNVWVHLTLKDGTYYLADKKLDLKNFMLIYDPLELNVWSQYLYGDQYYWFHLLTDSMTMSHGRLALCERELSLENPDGYDSMKIWWESNANKQWCIKKIEGKFSGMDLCLTTPKKMDFSEEIHLEGRIGVDPQKAYPFLSVRLQSLIERFSFSGGYTLEGELTFPKRNVADLVFLGTMSGVKCSVGGIDFSEISSVLEYKRDRIKISDLSIKDWAGSLSIAEALFSQPADQQEWTVDIDQLHLNDLRFSRLKCPWNHHDRKDRPFFRSLFIRSLALEKCSGKLREWETLLGSGVVEFTNLPKKTFITNLLFVPTEITARIGLDLTTFVPAVGKILYEIKEGKIYIKEFKEMYSDGKRSRFYLAEGTNAFVDFKGNLNMKVKMKQYNLLMKLAEFFTITVKGTLLHPTYTLSNHFEEDV